MNIHDRYTKEFTRRARAYYQACDHAEDQAESARVGGTGGMSRRQFLKRTGAVLLGATLGTALGSKIWPVSLASAHNNHEPVHIPGGTPLLGGGFHLFGPGFPNFDPPDAEPASITDFNGFIGLTYANGMVTRTNTQTGEVRRLPFFGSDMRFMKGIFRGTDGEIHNGAFAFV
jgi:hypothetical protein